MLFKKMDGISSLHTKIDILTAKLAVLDDIPALIGRVERVESGVASLAGQHKVLQHKLNEHIQSCSAQSAPANVFRFQQLHSLNAALAAKVQSLSVVTKPLPADIILSGLTPDSATS